MRTVTAICLLLGLLLFVSLKGTPLQSETIAEESQGSKDEKIKIEVTFLNDRDEATDVFRRGSMIQCEGTITWRGTLRPQGLRLALRPAKGPFRNAKSDESMATIESKAEQDEGLSGKAQWKGKLKANAREGVEEYSVEILPYHYKEKYLDANAQPIVVHKSIRIVRR